MRHVGAVLSLSVLLLGLDLALDACGSSDAASGSALTEAGAPSSSGGRDGGGPPGDAGTRDSAGPPSGQDAAQGSDAGGGGSDGGSPFVPGGPRFVGRVDTSDPSAPRFAWSGSGLVATVSGTKIAVRLKSEGSDAFYQPVVDGTPGTRFSVASGATATTTIADALPAGDHVVELYRESEGMYGDSVFLGFAEGTVKGAPVGSGRLVEIVGDSISCGYGNLGNEVHPPWDNSCTFSLDTESAYESYGMQLGRALDAEVSIVARSGWGMVRDLSGSTSGNVPSVYADAVGTNAAPAWSFARKVDAVLINLGTNDSIPGDPGQAFETGYVAFLKTVRGHYPGAWIFLTMGTITSDPMLTTMRGHLANVVAAFGDAKVVTIDMPVQDTSTTGCDYHPTVSEDALMAGILAPAMKAKLGW